jgi:ketosteroid isomerase-like protein
MGDVEDFHRDFLPRFIDAQRAFHDGDAEPNNTLWSTTDPVSLFAARGLSGIGTEDVTETFRFVASWFSDVRSYEWELLISDVSGDMAYTVAIERYTASREGQPPRADRIAGHPHLPSGGRPLACGAPARRPQATRPSGDVT